MDFSGGLKVVYLSDIEVLLIYKSLQREEREEKWFDWAQFLIPALYIHLHTRKFLLLALFLIQMSVFLIRMSL